MSTTAVGAIRPGTITTVAGTGQPGFSGDCGPATQATLNEPWSVAAHEGVLYIVEMVNNRIRIVSDHYDARLAQRWRMSREDLNESATVRQLAGRW